MTRKNRLRAKVKPFADHMAAIGDIHRMSIMYLLAHGPLDVRQIIDYTGISPSLMSHHLKILFEAGWVTRRKYGKRVEYAINPKGFGMLEKLFKDTEVGREIYPSK
jgi:ArsR family transcriptional regulator, arsenate/arsenite/antimonite-responsive transcriptional repressor